MKDDTSVSGRVIQYIQQLMMEGQLNPGDKLLSERQLSTLLNVSRPLVREAIKMLEFINVVEKRQGSGTYIKSAIDTNYFEPLSLAFKFRGGSIQEVFSFRRAVEEYAVREACMNASDADIRQLKTIEQAMEDATDTAMKSRLDQKLHYQIVKISRNRLMLDLLESISLLMDPIFGKCFTGDAATFQMVYDEHQGIIHAIETKNQQAAADCVRHHLSQLE